MAVAITQTQTYDGSFTNNHTVTAVDTSGADPYTIGFSFNKNPTAEVTGGQVDSNAATLVDTNENANVCAIQIYARAPVDGSSVWLFTTPSFKELAAIVVGLSGVASGTPYNSTVGKSNGFGTAARVTITGTAGSLLLVSVVAQGDKTFTAFNCTEQNDLTPASGLGGCFLGYVTATGSPQTVGADLSANDNFRIDVIEIFEAGAAPAPANSGFFAF